MATAVKSDDPTTELEVIESAITACGGHQACMAQVLRQRLESIHEHLMREPRGATCRDGELPVIDDALTWFGGIGAAPTPALKRGLLAIRERLSRRACSPGATPAIPKEDVKSACLPGRLWQPARSANA